MRSVSGAGGKAVAIIAFLWLCVAASLSIAHQPPPSHDAPSQQPSTSSQKVIVFGGDHDFAPFEYLDKSGQPAGFHIDLIRELGRVMDMRVEIRLGPWSRAIEDFRLGTVDVVAAFDAEPRPEMVLFADPHAVMTHEIFIRKGNSSITWLEDLAGKEVIVQDGALADSNFTARKLDCKLIRVETEADAVRLLASGKHDCAVTTSFGGRSALARLGLTNIHSVGPPILSANYCLSVRQGREELRDKINEGLGILRQTGKTNEIYNRWFGSLNQPYIPASKALRIGTLIVLPLIAILAFSLLWTIMLRRQVAKRTAELRARMAEVERADEQLRLLSRELDHRVRNTLAAVLSLFDQTAANADSLERLRQGFRSRVRGMSRAYNLLRTVDSDDPSGGAGSRVSITDSRSGSGEGDTLPAAITGARLSQAIDQIVRPYAGDLPDRIIRTGDDAMIPACSAQPFCLALNELATNALRHGALSTPDGRIHIHATLDSARILTLTWSESGQTLSDPINEGLGFSLIRGLIEHQLAGTVELHQYPAGQATEVTPDQPRTICTLRFAIDHGDHPENTRPGGPSAKGTPGSSAQVTPPSVTVRPLSGPLKVHL